MKILLITSLALSISTSYSYANDDSDCECEPATKYGGTSSLLKARLEDERSTQENIYVITPHKMTYILPVWYTDDINTTPYISAGSDEWGNGLKEVEAKIQVSFKIPLNYDSIFTENDSLYFAFTTVSWWQVYATDISSPFRETNYQPELFYLAPLQWHPNDANLGWSVGIMHQSNGRSSSISRSWNRVYLSAIYDKDDYSILFRPWIRLDESAEDDDNPDINDYMGHFELIAGYRMNNIKFTALGRQNFSEGHGYLELGSTFPLWGRLRGYLQLSTGYGESLIDYNHSQNRIGLGIAITDLF